MRMCWMNNAFIPLEAARMPVMDRGFLFADGIYEVTAVLDGRLVDSSAHLARLERSAAALGIAMPVGLVELEEIQRELVRCNALDQGTVYLQLTRGTAERDFAPPPGIKPNLLLFTQAKDILGSPAAQTGIAVAILPDLRWARRDIKSVMLLAQVLAKQAAAEAGAQEAWLEQDGYITEGASSSALIVTQDGVLITRPESSSILPGCTRKAVLALAKLDGIPIEERLFTRDEALSAREAIMTSASTFVLPVTQIDGCPIGTGKPGPVASALRRLYVEAARDVEGLPLPASQRAVGK